VVAALLASSGRRVNLYQALGMWPAGPDEWRTVNVHVRWFRRQLVRGYADGTYCLNIDHGSCIGEIDHGSCIGEGTD